MSSEQRSLSGYKSAVHEGTDFENPNEGKPPLDDSTEYIFRLKEFPKVKEFSQIKDNKDGTRKTVKIDKAICVFEEETSKNEVLAFFRVDSLNFSEDESFESGVVRFFKKIKTPLPEGIPPEWDKFFIVGMRFRGRVAIGKDENKKPVIGKYFLDVPTCRPILPSDMHPEAAATVSNQNASGSPVDGSTLLNALIIIKGCANSTDAYQRLLDAKVQPSLIQAFLAADKAGQINYPI